MGTLFGTDGVRGVANRDLTAELALALGSAAARQLCNAASSRRRVAVVGRDPRAIERKKYGLKKARKAPQYSKR